MPRTGRWATVAPVPGRTRPIGLGADDERSHQEDRKPRGGIPGGHGGGVEEALPGGAALATTKSREAAEARPQGRPSGTKAAAVPRDARIGVANHEPARGPREKEERYEHFEARDAPVGRSGHQGNRPRGRHARAAAGDYQKLPRLAGSSSTGPGSFGPRPSYVQNEADTSVVHKNRVLPPGSIMAPLG